MSVVWKAYANGLIREAAGRYVGHMEDPVNAILAVEAVNGGATHHQDASPARQEARQAATPVSLDSMLTKNQRDCVMALLACYERGHGMQRAVRELRAAMEHPV